MTRMAYLVATVIVAGVTLAACDKADGPPPSNVASNAKLQANHELGRQIYNFRCYYCHGYSGDAQTLASAYLNPVPRNFRESLPADLPLERVIDAVANGRVGTAMKGFSGTLTADDIFNVASFIIEEFTRAKAHNTHYHTEANGWRNLIATLGKSESEMARFLDMSLLDELQREGFFERIAK